MKPIFTKSFGITFAACLILITGKIQAHQDHVCPDDFPDSPILPGHIDQHDIASGKLTFKEVATAGERLFVGRFNVCDGQGRPATTGAGDKRAVSKHAFIRTSAPESNSCAGCHAQPEPGGAGDFVANVFVLAQALDPVTYSVDAVFSNERNTLGMHGSGAIEMLSREMTVDLQSQVAKLADGTHMLTTKGVEFKVRIVNGDVVASQGIDTDLVVKPFHQSGVVISLREFTVNAMNHHHGMQGEERFDLNPAKGFDTDFDEDGVYRELTIGDVTATTIWQAALGVPGRVMPKNDRDHKQAMRGEKIFAEVGCTLCHVPEMHLNSRDFVEPNPFNPEGTCSNFDVCPEYRFDMTVKGEWPRLERTASGGAVVRAYTDLKRHNLCDAVTDPNPIRYFCNEKLAQGRPDQDGRPGAEFFITRKLWDVGNTAPYGHRGDLTTITEAILVHGGEGRASRDAFVARSIKDQTAVVKFLKTFQILSAENVDRFIAFPVVDQSGLLNFFNKFQVLPDNN